jgi:hypothetical protein
VYTILNPHIIDFVAEPVLYKLVGRKPLKKYGYLISEALKKYGYMDILVDSGTSGFVPMHIYTGLPFFLRKILSKIEITWWKKRNKFGKEIKVHYSAKSIKNKKHLLFFNYKHYKNPTILQKTCKEFQHCIVHLSHYHSSTELQSEALKNIPNIVLAADVDISNNPYFNKFFSWYKNRVFILPFAVENRFVVKVPWQDRTDKILSVGTFHYCMEDYLEGRNPELKNFYETTKAKALHPLRRDIFERRVEFSDKIDCMNSPYIETKTGKSFWKILAPKKFFASQKQYFSFNIVDKFNEYKFVIVGEELIAGLPGIGTFEALACGCIVIGDKSAYGGQKHVNLVQTDNLTIEKAINIAANIFQRPDTHITPYSDEQNFLEIEKQLEVL